MNIKEQTVYYLDRLSYWKAKINDIQKVCPHEDVTAEYRANTGNWDAGDDSYWVDVKCNDCGSHFTVYNEDKDGYHYWGARVKK